MWFTPDGNITKKINARCTNNITCIKIVDSSVGSSSSRFSFWTKRWGYYLVWNCDTRVYEAFSLITNFLAKIENNFTIMGGGGQISTPFIGDIGLGSCVQKSQIQKLQDIMKKIVDNISKTNNYWKKVLTHNRV